MATLHIDLTEDGNWEIQATKVKSARKPPSEELKAFARERLRAILARKREERKNGLPPGLKLAFCPTGEGGGVDNSCSPNGGSGDSPSFANQVTAERTTPPPPPESRAYFPDPTVDSNGDGVADASIVGVPAYEIPDKIPQLPRLTEQERAVEREFAEKYEADPDGLAKDYLENVVKASAKEGMPLVFEVDAAKNLYGPWRGDDMTPEQRARFRAVYNTPLHQTADAVTKRAFLSYLDTLPEGSEILVTCGGCGAGKGWALKPENGVTAAIEAQKRSAVVWDSAGDQNATENPWIQAEAEKRGLSVNYLFVHADPYKRWSDPKAGVVQRAHDPKNGRMVDARVFADSYARGANNFADFLKENQGNPSATFTIVDATGSTPKAVKQLPKAATSVDADDLYEYATKTIMENKTVSPFVRRGATIGMRIWQ